MTTRFRCVSAWKKGDEVLAPEKTMDFHGTVVMKKKGWFRWLLDGVTLGE